MKVTKIFSWPLMKQSLNANKVLFIACTVVLCLMTVVTTYANNLLGGTETVDYTDAQTDFYSHLYVLASYNEMMGTELSYEDFAEAEDQTMYETAFEMASAQSDDLDLSCENFETAAETLAESEAGLDAYISQFEYVYALGSVQGCFSGDDLDIESMMTMMLEMMGIPSDMLETMSEMDTTAMMNQMYFTIMSLLPLILFLVFAGNALVVDQVDKGSMAYILSTPTKRSAVVITQAIYMIIMPFIMVGCAFLVKLAATQAFAGEVEVARFAALYGGLYLLAEAMAAICYLASCLFNLSKYALALGGGLNVWFFLCSLLGMFGSESMVSMGIGVEMLGNFNKLTIVGLFDIEALGTVGSGSVDYAFVPKLVALAVIALACYVVGMIRFQKKDLPL
ncbi:MAG: ABC transporter permease [Lachnospiraceae bacterium]|nr:ABC transporter permease [Lachnospiraceae bacterium]MCD7841772.1 ABC transporter permease [Lachnospiraceae bacterium]